MASKGVTRGVREAQSPERRKVPTITFFNTSTFASERRQFRTWGGAAKLASPGRHLTSLRPWQLSRLRLSSRQFPPVAQLLITKQPFPLTLNAPLTTASELGPATEQTVSHKDKSNLKVNCCCYAPATPFWWGLFIPGAAGMIRGFAGAGAVERIGWDEVLRFVPTSSAQDSMINALLEGGSRERVLFQKQPNHLGAHHRTTILPLLP